MMNTQVNKLFDKNIRKQVINNPDLAEQLLGYRKADGATFVVKVNSKNLIYIALPSSKDIGHIPLSDIQAAIATAGTVGTGSSLSTVTSSASSLSSTSTVASAK